MDPRSHDFARRFTDTLMEYMLDKFRHTPGFDVRKFAANPFRVLSEHFTSEDANFVLAQLGVCIVCGRDRNECGGKHGR
jgi:hypothetical protein